MSDSRTAEGDEFARQALRRMVADLVDELHDAIEDGLTEEALHSIVGLWEANNNNEDLTYRALVQDGRPQACDDCGVDITPYDEDGRPTEGGWEWYIVRNEVWHAASRDGEEAQFLCVGCLEERIGRRLVPQDFADLPINDVCGLDTDRLLDRLGMSR